MRKPILSTHEIYHVYNRGVNKQNIFEDEEDFDRFRRSVLLLSLGYVDILAYCLMPNHFHFLLEQITEDGISNYLQRLCGSHAKFMNAKYKRSGALFNPNFKAKRVDSEAYYAQISKYIHRNPLHLFLSENNEQKREELINYKWSSLRTYIGKSDEKLIDLRIISDFKNAEDYLNFLFLEIADPRDCQSQGSAISGIHKFSTEKA